MWPRLGSQGVERDLDPEAEMLHFLRQEIPNATEIGPWRLEAVNSTAGTIAMQVCRQAGKSCVLATRAVRRLKLRHTVLCVAPAERQPSVLARRDVRTVVKSAWEHELCSHHFWRARPNRHGIPRVLNQFELNRLAGYALDDCNPFVNAFTADQALHL